MGDYNWYRRFPTIDILVGCLDTVIRAVDAF